jgi:hypothetical protein
LFNFLNLCIFKSAIAIVAARLSCPQITQYLSTRAI